MESMPICYERERLIELLQRDALKLGTFTLASGRISHYYVDGRKLTLSAEGAALIGAGVLGLLLKEFEVDAIGGLTLGADPIVGATLALASGAGLGRFDGVPGSEGGERPRNGKSRRGTARAGLDGGDRRRRGDDGRLVASGRPGRPGDGLQSRRGDCRPGSPRRSRSRIRRPRLTVSRTRDHSRPGRRAVTARGLNAGGGRNISKILGFFPA